MGLVLMNMGLSMRLILYSRTYLSTLLMISSPEQKMINKWAHTLSLGICSKLRLTQIPMEITLLIHDTSEVIPFWIVFSTKYSVVFFIGTWPTAKGMKKTRVSIYCNGRRTHIFEVLVKCTSTWTGAFTFSFFKKYFLRLNVQVYQS